MAFITRSLILLWNKKIILIFGLSRSGTTMLGTFLALNKSSIYIHEPEVDMMKYHFGHYSPDNLGEFWEFVSSDQQKMFQVHALVCITLLTILKSPQQVKTICIKSVSLVDLIEEVSDALKNVEIIYICRHPAGRSESILRQRRHDQNIETASLEYLEGLGRGWGRTNSRIQSFFQGHSNFHWVFLRSFLMIPL